MSDDSVLVHFGLGWIGSLDLLLLGRLEGNFWEDNVYNIDTPGILWNELGCLYRAILLLLLHLLLLLLLLVLLLLLPRIRHQFLPEVSPTSADQTSIDVCLSPSSLSLSRHIVCRILHSSNTLTSALAPSFVGLS